MAQNELIEQLLGEGFYDDVLFAKGSLKEIAKQVADLNKQAVNLEVKMGSAGTLKDVVSASQMMISNQGKLSSAAKEYQALWKQLLRERDEAAKKAADLEVQYQKYLAEETKALNKQIAAEKKLQEAQSKAERKAALDEQKRLEMAYQATWKQQLDERDRLQAELERKQRKAAADAVAAVATDSLVGLRKTLSDLTFGFDRLTAAERGNAEIGGVLRARISELHTEISASEQATGRFQRNVGNYSSAVGGVQREITQLARELPSLQNGINTFISAIGNNLPMAVDAVQRLREENVKLREEGKPTTSVFRTLAGAIFNWQTALIVVLTVLPSIVNAMKNANSAAANAEKANKKYAESLNSIEEGSRNAANQEAARVQLLTKLAADERQTNTTRIQAVKELQSTYKDTFGLLTQQTILEGRLGDAIRQTTDAIFARASAQAAEKKFAAAQEKVYDLTLAERDALKEIEHTQDNIARVRSGQQKNIVAGPFGQNYFEVLQTTLAKQRETASEITAQRQEAEKESAGFLKDAADYALKAGSLFTKSDGRGRQGSAKDYSGETTKALQSQTKEIAEQLKIQSQIGADNAKQIVDDEKSSLKERLAALEDYYNERINIVGLTAAAERDVQLQALKGLDEREAALRKSGKLTAEAERAIAEERKAIQLKYDNAAYTKEQATNALRIEKEKETSKLIIEEQQKTLDAVVSGLKATAAYYTEHYEQENNKLKASLEKGAITVQQYKQLERNLRDQIEKQIQKDQLANLQEAIDILRTEGVDVQKLVDLYNQLASAKKGGGTSNKNALGFDKAELQNIQTQYGYYAQAIQEVSNLQTALSQKRVAQIEAEQAAIDKRMQAEIAAENASADAQDIKDHKIAEIEARAQARKDALAVKEKEQQRRDAERTKAITVALALIKGVLFVLESSSIPEAIARGVLVAAEVGAAVATPIPAFAEGTDDKPTDGPALVGEARPEVIIEPGKKPYLVDKPSILDLPRHTQVVPSVEEFVRMTYGMVSGAGLVGKHYNEYSGDNVVEELRMVGRQITRAINSKDPLVLNQQNNFYSPSQDNKIRKA